MLPPLRTPERRLSFRVAFAFNTTVLCAAAFAGWAWATEHGVVLAAAQRMTGEGDAEAFWVITKANLLLLATVVAGSCTLGIYPLIQLAVNGYLLGFGLSGLSASDSTLMPLAFRYIPIEFTAILLAASASHVFAADVLGYLVSERSMRIRQIVMAIAISVVLILIGASIEADVRRVVVERTASAN